MHTCLIHSGQIDAAFVTRVDLFRWCLLMGVAIISLELMEIVFLASLVTVNTYADLRLIQTVQSLDLRLWIFNRIVSVTCEVLMSLF